LFVEIEPHFAGPFKYERQCRRLPEQSKLRMGGVAPSDIRSATLSGYILMLFYFLRYVCPFFFSHFSTSYRSFLYARKFYLPRPWEDLALLRAPPRKRRVAVLESLWIMISGFYPPLPYDIRILPACACAMDRSSVIPLPPKAFASFFIWPCKSERRRFSPPTQI